MKYLLNTFILLLFVSFSYSQNSLKKIDDVGRVKISTYISNQIEGIPSSAKNLLKNKLNQIAMINGASGTSNSRFIITPNVSILYKEVLPGPPIKTVITLEVYFYIGDGVTGTLFASETLKVKGVGSSETKAYISAIKQIRTRNPLFKDLINQGKNKIVEYYNSQCDFVLKDADIARRKKDYDGAISKLMEIPKISKKCYETAMDQVVIVYQEKIDNECIGHLTKANNIWNTSLDANSANEASKYLALIAPDSKCFANGLKLSNTIGKKIQQLNQREWDFKMRQYQDNVNKKMAAIKAAKEIGIAQAKNQPKTVYNTKGWW